MNTPTTVDPFTLGDPSVAIHAATCGTSTVHVGHCHLDCGCWCHYHGDRDRQVSDGHEVDYMNADAKLDTAARNDPSMHGGLRCIAQRSSGDTRRRCSSTTG